MSIISTTKPALDFFPVATPREPQVECLDFITKAIAKDYRDIVVAAPTGVGKTFISAATCLWAKSFEIDGYTSGGYHLVGQKLLQDQIENDFPRFLLKYRTSVGSLKSSSSYSCPSHDTCMAGGLATNIKTQDVSEAEDRKCMHRSEGSCAYKLAYGKFCMASVAVTNYSYMFTEHLYLGELKPRNILVADEAHSVERQLLGFIEVCITQKTLENWAPGCLPVPVLPDIIAFIDWMRTKYGTQCKERLDMLDSLLQDCDYKNRKLLNEFSQLQNHVGRMSYAVDNIAKDPTNWIFWQDKVDGGLNCNAKPLNAAPYVPKMINQMGAVRLYMSAYPGPKEIFCRNLGLDTKKVAWLELDSTFPVESRLINITPVGSMSRKYIEQTMPALLGICKTILEVHSTEKGLIHCNSYGIGLKIFNFLQSTPMRSRIIFPLNSSDRNSCFLKHRNSKEPTVMISPSIAEGFSFDDDLARFQIIAKCPFPFIGDRQVKAKMELDYDWYILQTVQTIVQACGRGVRSEKDHCVTYITDADFIRLYERHSHFFPAWLTKAFRWHNAH